MTPTNQAREGLLHVSLPGEFRIKFGKTAVSISPLRHQSLLAYLILNRDKIHTRQQLALLQLEDRWLIALERLLPEQQSVTTQSHSS